MGPFPFPILFQPQKNGGVLLLKMQRLQTGRLLILLTHQEATRLGLFDRDLSDQRYRLVCARLLGEACRRFRRFPLTGTVQARSVFLPGGEMLFWFLLPPARRFHLKHKYRYLCCHVPENDAFLSLWGRLCREPRINGQADMYHLAGRTLLLLSLPLRSFGSFSRLCGEFANCRHLIPPEAAWLQEHGTLCFHRLL